MPREQFTQNAAQRPHDATREVRDRAGIFLRLAKVGPTLTSPGINGFLPFCCDKGRKDKGRDISTTR